MSRRALGYSASPYSETPPQVSCLPFISTAPPIPPEYGGPVRLIVPGGDCFMNIKWLDHLELRNEPGPNTAKTIALGRLASVEEGGC